ncbi:MAG TPA: hypothetical protein PLB88_08515 [Thermoanaerobaculaceae bacterium]|nr:hypothetical protein [Thermoanaerobaculaceae bacterium]
MTRDTTLPAGVQAAATAPAYSARHAVRIGLPTPILLCEGPGSLVIGGETYLESALFVGSIGIGPSPGVTIRVPNDTNQVSDPDATADGVLGAAVLVYEVKWDISTGAQLDPVQLFEGIVAAAKYNAASADLTCTTRTALTAGMVGRVVGRLCNYTFKGPRCAYSGAGTSCDHTLATCTAFGNDTRYGGWPTIPPIGTKFAYTITQPQGVGQQGGTVAPAPKTQPPTTWTWRGSVPITSTKNLLP